jgi:cation diffusion facilitator family transporter
LACLKLLVGFSIKSAALIADGIHSGMDIISSAVTYIGIREAEKPADKEHPYGHYRSETIAGFVVIFLLFISAVWIIYEGIIGIIKNEPHTISGIALLVVIISIIANEAMARIKFKVGRREDSLALIADAEHSHADSLSSIAVLVGLSLIHWFPQADGITAILVGCYILYETIGLGKEVTDNLLDVSNPQVEEQIKKICLKEEIELLEMKTRKIGAKNFAELKSANFLPSSCLFSEGVS